MILAFNFSPPLPPKKDNTWVEMILGGKTRLTVTLPGFFSLHQKKPPEIFWVLRSYDLRNLFLLGWFFQNEFCFPWDSSPPGFLPVPYQKTHHSIHIGLRWKNPTMENHKKHADSLQVKYTFSSHGWYWYIFGTRGFRRLVTWYIGNWEPKIAYRETGRWGTGSGDSWMYPYQRTPMGNPYISPT